MFKLQEFTVPQADVCAEEELYFRTPSDSSSKYNFEEQSYFFLKGDVLEGNTYFNMFSAWKWMKYTQIQKFFVKLIIKGKFEVNLVKSFLADDDIVETIVKQMFVDTDTKEASYLEYDCSLDQFEGSYFIRLKALDDKSFFYGGGYYTDMTPTHKVKLGAVICTYKREKFVYKNLYNFQKNFFNNQDSAIQNKLDLFVVDNAHTLDEKKFNIPHVHLFQNKNVGGAGGFTRGIIEILQSNTAYTHIILMDDDAITNLNAFEITYSFLSFLKEEYMDVYIGGATLRLDKQYIQLEAGAVWNNNLLFNVKHNLDLRSVRSVLFNELEESRSYNAWVYNCIPVSDISLNNLPLPLFVRGDDMEYGMRNSKKIINLNGICAWHAPLHNKYSFFMNYYVLRNQLIINALYDDNFSKKSAIKLLKHNLLHELLLFRYENVELIFKAYEDFLKGAQFLLDSDGEVLHQEIMKMAPKMEDFNRLSRTDAPFIYDKLNLSYKQADNIRFKRFIRIITLNGYLLPKFLYKKGGWSNYTIVELTKARSVNFFRYNKVLQVDLVANKGYVTHMQKKKLFSTLARCYKMAFSMRCGSYDRACKSYRSDMDNMTNIDFWKKYLSLK